MSSITVRIPTPLRPFVEDASVLDADADTVGAALEQIGARHPAFLQRVMQGEALDSICARFVAKDGSEIYVVGSASCKLEDGKPLYTRGIFRDITAQKKAVGFAHGLDFFKLTIDSINTSRQRTVFREERREKLRCWLSRERCQLCSK